MAERKKRTVEPIRRLSEEPEISNLEAHAADPHDHAIEFRGVRFSYVRNKPALDGVSMIFHRGTFTTVIGPNASGKSTLVKVLMKENVVHPVPGVSPLPPPDEKNYPFAANPPSPRGEKGRFVVARENFLHRGRIWWDKHVKRVENTGEVFIDGHFLHRMPARQIGRTVAYIPQFLEVPAGLSVREFVSFGRIPHLGIMGVMRAEDKRLVDQALARLGIADLALNDMHHLSGGQRQKALVALALAQDTQIIVLDEPTTYLDIKNQYEILDILSRLHEEGKTVVAILHDINQAVQYSDYIYILKDGKNFAEGPPEEVITTATIERVYGVRTSMFLHKGRRYISNVEVVRDHEKQDAAGLQASNPATREPL